MAKKLRLYFYVPYIGQKREYALLDSINGKGVAYMICQLLNEEFPGLMLEPEKTRLVSRELRKKLDCNKSLKEQEIHDGTIFVIK